MFKDKLKELREKEGLTQQELADKIFVSRSAVAKWENGNGIPSDVNLDAICKLFNVEEEWLLERQELKKLIRLNKKKVIELSLTLFLIVVILLFNINKYYYIEHFLAALSSSFTLFYLIYNLYNKQGKVFKIINILFVSLCYTFNMINWIKTSFESGMHFFYIIMRFYANIELTLANAQFASIVNILILTIILIVNKILSNHFQ